LPGASLQGTDVLAVADLSASETKKITSSDLVSAGYALQADGTLDPDKLDLSGINAEAIAGTAITANTLPADRIVASSLTATQIATDAIGAAQLADDAVDTAAIQNQAVTAAKIADDTITATQIAADAITASELADDSVDTAAIQNLAVTGAKIADDTITATQIAADAITASELADNSVDTAAVVDGAITNAKLAGGITSDKIDANAVGASQLADDAVDTAAIQDLAVTNAKLAGGITGDKIVADAIGASQLADLAVDTGSIQDAAVTNAKLAGGITSDKITSVDGSAILSDTITATQIAANAVTASELADSSVDTASIIDSAVTDAKLASGIDGAKLTADTVTAAKIPAASLDRGIDKTSGSIGHTNSITAGTHNGISFDAQGHVTGTSALASADLPIANTTQVGGISVPAASGLSVSNVGEVSHQDTVTADSVSGITYNSTGHITSTRALLASDLPTATAADKGAVSVPGPSLTVDGSGVLSHASSGVAPGTYQSVSVDARGHVTSGGSLTASMVPSLDASKITTGTFGSAFLAPNSVTAEQLADYGIAQVSETAPTPEFAGQWWINPSDRSAYIWIGTVSPENGYWLLVGYGSPTQLNLRFGGTYNASTNTVSTLNQYGTEAGLTIGQALGAPSSLNNGVYLAVTTAGTGTTPAPAVSLAVGDWVLSEGTGSNWTKVAVVSGASGTFNDYDILSDGTYFTPNMPGVADVRDALELLWGRVQIASTVTLGVVKESTEVLVDNSTGEMTVGVVDDGTY